MGSASEPTEGSAVIGTWVTEKLIVPRLGLYTGDEKPEELRELTPEESRGLKWALWATIIVTLLMVWSALPVDSAVPGAGWLRDPKAGIGTVIATMLPYTVAFMIVWMVIMVVFVVFAIPVGPGSPMFIPVPGGG